MTIKTAVEYSSMQVPETSFHLGEQAPNFERKLAGYLKASLLCCPAGKPISLTYRCPCRYFESHVSKSHIKHLKILTVPGCSLQIIARLKNSSKQICIDPKLKWIHEYLEKYLHKRVKM
ncbi:stromal cell-derived factor 1 [Python bivittatus]|uniref:Stromal cell-derived factor 1 n=1 Tax=Python bivittatus TaxID=176946 RepID=A0A9F2QYW9_PYTBI|nr:stromal cell-derived factor 1 [Python bivittatus]